MIPLKRQTVVLEVTSRADDVDPVDFDWNRAANAQVRILDHSPVEVLGDDIDQARASLDAAVGQSVEAQSASVVAAVKFIATIVHYAYPEAKRVQLDDSDQGDWLTYAALDGDREVLDGSGLEDDLDWATSCIYDSHREAAEGKGLKTRAEDRTLTRSSGSDLYIDIEEALRG